MSLATNFRWAFQETVRKIRQDFFSFFFAVFLTSLALTIPLFIATIGYGLSEPLRNLPVAVEITIFTKEGASIPKLTESISQIAHIDSVRVIKKEDAFKELSQSIGINKDSKIKNPLPDIIIASMSANVTQSNIEEASKAIEALDGIDMVPVDANWHEKLQALANASNVAIILLGSVVLVLVVLVIASAIHVTTLSAKHELRALNLFGASPAFACRPFAWRGFIQMACATILALGFTQIGLVIFGKSLSRVAQLYELDINLSLPNSEYCTSLVLILSVAGALAASIAARRSWKQLS